jgi:hypothetical protein
MTFNFLCVNDLTSARAVAQCYARLNQWIYIYIYSNDIYKTKKICFIYFEQYFLMFNKNRGCA